MAPQGAAPALAYALPVAPVLVHSWSELLEKTAEREIAAGHQDVMDRLTEQFESILIKTALRHTHGRRIEAAQKLGIGRNTITRKIQQLGIETSDTES